MEAFEEEFARFLGVAHVVGVGSGTDALRLALLALGIGPGDGVITAPMTFIATAEAIVQTGAVPEFVDVDPDTGNLSPARAAPLSGDRAMNGNGSRTARHRAGASLWHAGCAMPELRAIADGSGC